MLLKDYVNGHVGESTKIGAGTGYIFCDTISEETLSLLDKMAEKSYTRRTNQLESMEKKYMHFDEDWADHMKLMIKMYKKRKAEEEVLAKKEKREAHKFMPLAEYKKQLKRQGVVRKDNLKRIIDYETGYLKDWITYSLRNIKEERESIAEDGVKIVLFNGDEAGRWWTCEEYRRGYIK